MLVNSVWFVSLKYKREGMGHWYQTNELLIAADVEDAIAIAKLKHCGKEDLTILGVSHRGTLTIDR